jgi:hypothetical protein
LLEKQIKSKMSNTVTPQYLTFDTEQDYYPLDEKIVLVSGVATFESQAARFQKSSPDYEFLSSLPEVNVYYGAADAKIHPFICFPETPLIKLPVGRTVLTHLRASCFESEHIENLDVTDIPFPGYHPHTRNDEIHSNPDEQHLFEHDIETINEDEFEELQEFGMGGHEISYNYHKSLRGFVLDKHLYYVLIHTKPKRYKDFEFSEYVILFAIGVSPKTGNLVGVVGHQVCHNLCD